MFNTNHIFIGVSYIVLSMLGGSSGFVFSTLLGMELSILGYIVNSIMSYLNFISLHGILMLFLLVMLILIGGFGNILVPIMLGLSDMTLSRSNLFSLWLGFFSLLAIWTCVAVDCGLSMGWTLYVPLSVDVSTSVYLLIFYFHIAGVSSILSSFNFLITILSSHFLGNLAFSFLPLFSYGMLVTSAFIMIALPVLASAAILMLFDRNFNATF